MLILSVASKNKINSSYDNYSRLFLERVKQQKMNIKKPTLSLGKQNRLALLHIIKEGTVTMRPGT